MDSNTIFAKTPIGDDAVRQSTRLVQRNLRMVLLQVDGTLSVEQLAVKIGNQRLVEGALQELAEGGFIEAVLEPARAQSEEPAASFSEFSAPLQFPDFSKRDPAPLSSVPPPDDSGVPASVFSAFSRPPPSIGATGSFSPPPPPPPAPVARKPLRPRRRISLGRWLFRGLVGVVLLAAAVVPFYPYGDFRPALEAELSRRLAMPVEIGEVSLGLWPSPRLLLDKVTIGAGGEGRITRLAITAPYLLLDPEGRHLPEVEVSGARLTANRLLDLPMFNGQRMATDKFPLRRLRIVDAAIALGDLATPEWHGEIDFGLDGSVEQARFQDADGDLRLEAMPRAAGLELNIDFRRWNPQNLPFGFENLYAVGQLQKNRLLLRKVETHLLGGRLAGNGVLDWSEGMALSGEASLTQLDSRQVTSALAPNLRLTGELGGALRLRASGKDWQDMLGLVEAYFDAEMARGTLTGTDLGELARRGSGAVVQSGTTYFEALRARLEIANGRVAARNIELDAGLMKARGQATVVEASGRIEGNITVQARSSVLSASVPAQLSGTLRQMILTAPD